MSADGSTHEQRPLLRVVHGSPTAEELAALVTVLAASGGAAGEQAPATGATSQWATPARLLRAPVGPGGWWASALPR